MRPGKPPIRRGSQSSKPTSEFEAKRGSRAHTSGQGGGPVQEAAQAPPDWSLRGDSDRRHGGARPAGNGDAQGAAPGVITKHTFPVRANAVGPRSSPYFRIVHPDTGSSKSRTPRSRLCRSLRRRCSRCSASTFSTSRSDSTNKSRRSSSTTSRRPPAVGDQGLDSLTSPTSRSPAAFSARWHASPTASGARR